MSTDLICPMCRSDVRVGASMCLKCHLPMKDVLAHQPTSTTWDARFKRLRSAIVASVVYVAIASWCAWKLPDTLPFVVPGAAAGLFLHAVKNRPWIGAITSAVIVFAIPALLWPSMLTGAFSDLTNGRY